VAILPGVDPDVAAIYCACYSRKVVKSGSLFKLLYLLKYFGMVTMEQKEGKRVENVLSDSQLNYLKSLS
jgi:hypothetical protein